LIYCQSGVIINLAIRYTTDKKQTDICS
jgi:hypothetical protein